MAVGVEFGGTTTGSAGTLRTDSWWIGPLLTFLGLSAFIIYSTWAAIQGGHYYYGPYLSPFYSPLIYIDSSVPGAAPLSHAWLGEWPSWWPSFLPSSPAFLILIVPIAFRGTCYYYRKAYYRSFCGSPPACAVRPVPRGPYRGETGLLLVQNLHRYSLYLAILLIVILYDDAFRAFSRDGRFGIGVGSLILLINPTLLAAYTFGCHSLRHLVGGGADCFSKGAAGGLRHGLWKRVTFLNGRHMPFAWLSLFWVGLTDLYVRLVSMGIVKDLNTWG